MSTTRKTTTGHQGPHWVQEEPECRCPDCDGTRDQEEARDAIVAANQEALAELTRGVPPSQGGPGATQAAADPEHGGRREQETAQNGPISTTESTAGGNQAAAARHRRRRAGAGASSVESLWSGDHIAKTPTNRGFGIL